MRLPRIRFTLGQLTAIVAALAVLFAALRTPFWPLLPAVGLVLVGFRLDRARGREGLGGAMIAGIIVFTGFLVVDCFYDFLIHGWNALDLPALAYLLGIMMFGGVGLVFGLITGSLAFWVLYILDELEAYKRTGADARPDDPCGLSPNAKPPPSPLLSSPGQEAIGSDPRSA